MFIFTYLQSQQSSFFSMSYKYNIYRATQIDLADVHINSLFTGELASERQTRQLFALRSMFPSSSTSIMHCYRYNHGTIFLHKKTTPEPFTAVPIHSCLNIVLLTKQPKLQPQQRRPRQHRQHIQPFQLRQ